MRAAADLTVELAAAKLRITGLEETISPEGALPSPMQRMSYNINKFDG